MKRWMILLFTLILLMPDYTVLAGTKAAKISQKGDATVRLTFGGDCVLGTREEWQQTDNRFGAALAQHGLAYPFQNLLETFEADDLTLLNLECVLQQGNAGHDYTKQHTFRGSPDYAKLLPLSSVELVNIANNHYVDYRNAGRKSTQAALKDAGVPYCGYKELYVLEVGGYKIGFGGCRETVFLQSKPTVYRDIRKLKKMGCDVIIYSCHWGKEYAPEHNSTQQRMAQYAVNAGADIIVGTHPHVVQGVASLTASKGKRKALVLYSLGNLVFGGTHEMQTFDAALAQVELRFEKGAYKGASLTFVPVLTSGSAPENNFQPVLATGADSARILQLIGADSDREITQNMWFPRK